MSFRSNVVINIFIILLHSTMATVAISEKLSAGNFEDAAKDAEVIFKAGNQFRPAVYIIRKVCSAVLNVPTLSQVQTQNIKRICCLCLHVMIRDKVGDIIEVDQKLTASLFHISKSIAQDDPEAFAEIVSASLMVFECMPNANDSKQCSTLIQLCRLVTLNFAKLLDTLSKSNDADIESQLQKYLEMVLQSFNLLKKDFSFGFSAAQKIIVYYCEKVKTAKQMEEFAAKIIFKLNQSLLGISENDQDPDLNEFFFKSLMAVGKTFRCIFSIHEYELAFKIWKDMIGVLDSVLPPSSIESKALSIIYKSLKPFLFSVDSVPSSSLPFPELQEALVLVKNTSAENTNGCKALEQAAWAISFVLSFLMSHWCRVVPKIQSFLPVASLSDVEELFSQLVKILRSGSCFLCVHQSTQCVSKGDIYYPFQLELVLLFWCAWIISWTADSRALLFKVCENSFGRCEELLLKVAEKSCLKSVDFYSYLCDRVYAIAVKNADNPEMCKKVAERGKEWCLQYIKSSGRPPPFALTAKKTMRILAMKHRDLNQASAACEAVAVALLLDNQSSEESEANILSAVWSDMVSAFPNEYVPLLILLTNNKTVKDFIGDTSESTCDSTQLYFWETMTLGSRKPQKFSVLRTHWKTRNVLNFSPLQKIKSAAYFLGALGLCADLEKVQEFITSFKTKQYHELLKAVPSGDRPVALCALAQLVYCRFLVDKRIHEASLKKRVEEVKKVEPLKKAVLSAEDVVNENDVCDLTPTYVDLNVSKEASLLSNLDTALRYWDEALKMGLEASLLSRQELRLFGDCLTTTALHYRLSGHYLKEKYAWEVCRSFGLQVRSDQLVLRAVGGLMELGCCDAGWVQRANTIAATLADDSTAKKVLHIYKNSYIVYCFSHDKAEEGAALVKEVLKLEDKGSWLNIKSRFVLAKILLKTPSQLRRRLFSEQYNVFVLARECYAETTYLIKKIGTKAGVRCWSNGTEHASVTDLLFATALLLGYTYLEMMLPREARCYLKLHLLIVQKMGLSARTAQCLSLLGKVDLLVQKIEESIVKVEGLKQILEIESAKREDDGDQVAVYRDEEDVDRLRLARKVGNQSGASPELLVARYVMPDFVSHKSTCSCFYCSHILIHSMWLDVGLIQAEAFSSQDQIRPARNFFNEAMKLADTLRDKDEKLLSEFSDQSLMLEDLIRSETMLRLKYADLLIVMRRNSDLTVKQAWEINEGLCAFLDKTQSKDVLLRADVGEQKIALIDIRSLRDSTRVSKQYLPVSTTSAKVTPTMLKSKNVSGLQTPLPTCTLGGRPRTPLEPIAAKNVIPIKEKTFLKGRGVLPVLFHLSDSEEETEGEKSAKPVRNLKAKPEGKEDRMKEREKKPIPRGKSTKGKETKTNLKPSRSATKVNTKNDSDKNVIVISDSEDGREKKLKPRGMSTKQNETKTNSNPGSSISLLADTLNVKTDSDNGFVISDSDSIIQATDSEDDLQTFSRLVSPGLQFKGFRTSKKVLEAPSKVKISNSVNEVDFPSRKTKETRNKVETSDVEADKAKSRKLVKASGKTSESSIPVRITRSRRFL